MDNYQITVGVEPTNEYDKARQDVIKAFDSVRKLPLWQQQKLAEELFGAANVAMLFRLLNQK